MQEQEKIKLSDEGLSIAINNYNHIEQQATLAATKSALLVAAHALLATAYVSITKDYNVFVTYSCTFLGFTYGIAGGAILVAFFLSLLAILPRSTPGAHSDLLFFANIASQQSAQIYCSKFHKQDTKGFHEMLLHTIYGKSVWLCKNFRCIRYAIFCSLLGTTLAVISFIAMSQNLNLKVVPQ